MSEVQSFYGSPDFDDESAGEAAAAGPIPAAVPPHGDDLLAAIARIILVLPYPDHVAFAAGLLRRAGNGGDPDTQVAMERLLYQWALDTFSTPAAPSSPGAAVSPRDGVIGAPLARGVPIAASPAQAP